MNTKGPRPTYMSPEEFTRLGERCFGHGWQGTLARYVGYNRVAVNRYAVGAEPVPVNLAICLAYAADRLDRGIPVQYVEPVGEIVNERFEPNRSA